MKNKNLAGNLFTKTPLVQSEASLSNAVGEYLNRKKIFHLRLNAGMANIGGRYVQLCPKGTPDRFFIYKGFHVFLELKKVHEKITADQHASHYHITQSGGYVKVVYSLDDVIGIIKWIDRIK
jgi:hypothetical protein